MGDEGAEGWAAWEASQGLALQTPTNARGVPSGHDIMANEESVTARQEKEEKGGWGQWVPLMPETPLEPKSAPMDEEDEAAAEADEVRDSLAPTEQLLLCLRNVPLRLSPSARTVASPTEIKCLVTDDGGCNLCRM